MGPHRLVQRVQAVRERQRASGRIPNPIFDFVTDFSVGPQRLGRTLWVRDRRTGELEMRRVPIDPPRAVSGSGHGVLVRSVWLVAPEISPETMSSVVANVLLAYFSLDPDEQAHVLPALMSSPASSPPTA